MPPYSDGSQSPVETVIGSWGHDANGISVEPGDATFIARNNPARVLAECAAKRAIIKQRGDYAECAAGYVGIAALGARCAQQATQDALKALAAVYSDHSDYQKEWAA